uniref:Uncharacterized protein n=1 Tax=Vitrella brassicaformis TaxID=1169539 RepID=A0A7S1KBB1_9ALVE
MVNIVRVRQTDPIFLSPTLQCTSIHPFSRHGYRRLRAAAAAPVVISRILTGSTLTFLNRRISGFSATLPPVVVASLVSPPALGCTPTLRALLCARSRPNPRDVSTSAAL